MTSSLPRARSILYVAALAPFSTATYRFESLLHLGQQVQPLDLESYEPSTRVERWLRFRYPFGPLVARVNRELRNTVATLRPDVVWFDKPIAFTRKPCMPSIRLARKSSSTCRTRHSDRAMTGAGGSSIGSTGWPTSIAWYGKLTLLVIATGGFRGSKPCSVLIRACTFPRIPASAMQTVIARSPTSGIRTSSARNSSRARARLSASCLHQRQSLDAVTDSRRTAILHPGKLLFQRTISLGHLEVEDQPQLRNGKQRK